jgi:ankyrin repeat protein
MYDKLFFHKIIFRFHHTDITEWLLDAKQADVSKRTASNGLPLHFAVVGGDYDAVKVLLDEDPTYVQYIF